MVSTPPRNNDTAVNHVAVADPLQLFRHRQGRSIIAGKVDSAGARSGTAEAWLRRIDRIEYKRRIVWKETQGV